MKLHGSPLSPFVQRVLLAARIKGVELDLVPLPRGGMQSEAFAAISPMRRIPVLEEDDGWTMVESSAIVAYLEDSRPGPSLLPDDARIAAKARMIDSILDSEIASGLRHFVVQKWFRACDEPSQLEYGRRQIDLGLDAVERIGVGSGPWLVGSQPTLADAALIPFMVLGELIEEASDSGPLMSGRPGIDGWWSEAQATPLARSAISEMRAAMAAMVAKNKG